MDNERRTNRDWDPRFEMLDYGRGVAVLAVLLFHGFSTGYDRALDPMVDPLKQIAGFGWLGVDLFFVISGYCIAANVYSLSQRGRGPLDFIKGRFWRIMPTYWASFFLAVLIALSAIPFNQTSVVHNLPASGMAWLANLFLVQPYFHTTYYQDVYWSLIVESQFYALTMILFLLRRWVPAIVLVILACIPAWHAVWIPSSSALWNSWPEFVSGGLVFYFICPQSRYDRLQKGLALSGILSFLAMGVWTYHFFPAYRPLSGIIFALVLCGVYRFDRQFASLRGLGWLRFIGVISYSLYLLHSPIQGRVVNLLMRYVPWGSPRILWVQMAGWSVAIGCSYLLYRWVEKPAQQWRKGIRPTSKSEANATAFTSVHPTSVLPRSV